ncbi:MAG: CHAD domain-containing protein [Isosphaeraceae bacterium]
MSLSIAQHARDRQGFSPDDPARLAVRSALADIADRIDRDENAAMEGDVEGLHRLRAALRRLRGTVRTFKPLLEPAWATRTADDCRWAGRWLGQVRDLDVLEARLREAIPEADHEAFRPILERIKARRRPARQALRQGLASDRFRDLRERCRIASQRPPTVDEAERPCAEALPALLESAWKSLRKHGRRLDRDDPDAAFHAVRIRAKRARYAAEMIAPGLPGKHADAARKLAKRATDIQDCLGSLQDTAVASEFLAAARSRFPDNREVRRLLKRLLKAQEREAHRARADFRKLWEKLERVHGWT